MNTTVIAETIRRQINPLSVIFIAFLGLLALSLADFDAPGKSWRPLLALLGVVAAAQIIGPEFSTGTLQLILAKPVNRSVYLVSRVAGVWLAICAAMYVLLAVEVSTLLLDNREVPWRRVVLTSFNDMADMLLVIALLALLGTVMRMHFNVVVYFGIFVALEVTPMTLRALRRRTNGFLGWLGEFVREHPGIDDAVVWLNRNLYPDSPSDFNRGWLLMVLSNAAIALFVATLIFRRREVPYGGD